MLSHERAYLKWLEAVFKRYPDLVIENCSSGGLRMDYAMLSRYSIQSTSDQDDYRYYCTIAANSPSALTPEQSAIWSYHFVKEIGKRLSLIWLTPCCFAFIKVVNLAELTQERRDLVKEHSIFTKLFEKISKIVFRSGQLDYRSFMMNGPVLVCNQKTKFIWLCGEEMAINLSLKFHSNS